MQLNIHCIVCLYVCTTDFSQSCERQHVTELGAETQPSDAHTTFTNAVSDAHRNFYQCCVSLSSTKVHTMNTFLVLCTL